MIYAYVLIVWTHYGGSTAIQTVEFQTEALCISAGDRFVASAKAEFEGLFAHPLLVYSCARRTQ